MSDHLPQTFYLEPELLQKLGDLELVAREAVEGLRVGSHHSPLRGFSTEFAHHRQYAPGDAIRDIDWRVYGRTDRYYTKLYEAETNQPERIRADYLASLNAHLEAFRAGCVRAGIDYTVVDTSRPLDAVLNQFFFERQSMLVGPSAGARS